MALFIASFGEWVQQLFFEERLIYIIDSRNIWTAEDVLSMGWKPVQIFRSK